MSKYTHDCNICYRTMDWDDLIWLNPNFGVCERCYDDIPDKVKDDIREEYYTVNTIHWLDMAGANY